MPIRMLASKPHDGSFDMPEDLGRTQAKAEDKERSFLACYPSTWEMQEDWEFKVNLDYWGISLKKTAITTGKDA